MRRYAALAASLLVSYWVLWNTALVTSHNLGARDGIGYINGGKVFRLTGTMWYHIPGLVDIGLAPQNLGGRINLRNNEFALLQLELGRLDSTTVDFELAPNAQLFVVLDRHGEGTFWAVRLTAFEDAKSPFINALVRYEDGRIVERHALSDLGAMLTAGRHSATVSLDAHSITVTVDGVSQQRPFATGKLVPKLALGCGELNATVFRWAVSGADSRGRPVTFEESFSVAETLWRSWGAISFLALLAWGLLFGLPLLKVVFDTRRTPVDLLPDVLSRPLPRLLFAAACVVPWMPLFLQWVLAGIYVVLAWLTISERLSDAKAMAFPPAKGPSRQLVLGLGGALSLLAVLAFAVQGTLLEGSLDRELAPLTGAPVGQAPGKAPLVLGDRILLPIPRANQDSGVTVQFQVTLGEAEVAVVDFLRSKPTRADMFQVDRGRTEVPGSQPAARPDPTEANDEDAASSVADYRAVSAVVSSDTDFPGMLRWLEFTDVSRTPWGGWTLGPGTHDVVATVQGELGGVFINGRLVDYRTDVDRDLRLEAVQIQSLSGQVAAVSDVTMVAEIPAALETAAERAQFALLIGALGFMCLLVGLVAFGTAAAFPWTPGPVAVRGVAARTLRKLARASGLGLLWAGWVVYVRWGTTILRSENFQIALGAAALLVVAFNVRQLHRAASGGTSDTLPALGARFRRATARWVGIVLVLLVGFEAVTRLFPEWRFDTTRFWHAGLGPRYYWVHDPMVRRLNPWFIDQRFKRRDYLASHPDTLRIAVFGGSQTYGWGIPSKDRMAFSDQLERALHAKGHPEVEVLSAAFPGVKTGTGLRWFASNLLRYEPDIIVINFVVNEFMNVDQYHVWSGERTGDSQISSFVVPALAEHWRGLVMGNHLSQILAADIYQIYAMETYLRWTIEIARAHNIEVVLSIEPTNLYIESGGGAIMRGEEPNADAKAVYARVGQELDVPVFDVLPSFLKEPENLWFYDTMHMSRLGHKIFGAALADLIAERFLDTPAGPRPLHE